MNQNLWLEPIVQYGFLGLSAILLGIIVWLIRRLLVLLEQTNSIIAQNTQAIAKNSSAIDEQTLQTAETAKAVWRLHDKLISRPCIAAREQGA